MNRCGYSRGEAACGKQKNAVCSLRRPLSGGGIWRSLFIITQKGNSMNVTKQYFRYVSQTIFGLIGTSCYILADT